MATPNPKRLSAYAAYLQNKESDTELEKAAQIEEKKRKSLIKKKNQSNEKYINKSVKKEQVKRNLSSDDADDSYALRFIKKKKRISSASGTKHFVNKQKEEPISSDEEEIQNSIKTTISDSSYDENFHSSTETKISDASDCFYDESIRSSTETKISDDYKNISKFVVKEKNKKGKKKKIRVRKDSHEESHNGVKENGMILCEETNSHKKQRRNKNYLTPSKSLSHPFINVEEELNHMNFSSSCGNPNSEEMFKWLINPVEPQIFYENFWEKKPLHIQRTNSQYFEGLFSCEDFDKMLIENKLQYSVHVDVLTYENGKRTYNHEETKVNPTHIWDSFKKGYSIRHRCPQVYNSSLWKVCSLLQEYFSSYVGANMYLTPPGTQGFPPHYDDIEAFILQIEGTKHWKIYKPRNKNEMLARLPSKDFNDEEVKTPDWEITLNAGDMLYFPRGFIHEAQAADDVHSLHLTVSTCQLNTWGDLLEKALPQALNRAIENNVLFRQSVPNDYLDYVGTSSSNITKQRAAIKTKIIALAREVLNNLDINEAADKHSLNFIHGSMPPFLSKMEKYNSIHGNGSSWIDGKVMMLETLHEDVRIRLIRKRAIRLIIDEHSTKIYYTLENSKTYKEQESLYIEIEPEFIESFQLLLNMYPSFVKIKDLSSSSTEDKIYFAGALYDNGLIMTAEPLAKCDMQESDYSDEESVK